ncbi:hypothetical protein O53_624 [Microcystis aeruginosa TAIHU98]|uniref:Uncharacterized protein n=1 Tax=Microcystis aeruginosa TAIHU98 TaxID=1134457 RepID=L7E995_MICAE|nr:hypothetical protein O53_624 [Microcystis aeruginosa TAIHU98]
METSRALPYEDYFSNSIRFAGDGGEYFWLTRSQNLKLIVSLWG